jgi:hypothetical protein
MYLWIICFCLISSCAIVLRWVFAAIIVGTCANHESKRNPQFRHRGRMDVPSAIARRTHEGV